MQKHTSKIASAIAFAAVLCCAVPIASNANPIESLIAQSKGAKKSPKPAKDEAKLDGIGTLFIKLNEPQIVCKSRESADVINLIASEEVDESTRQKIAPMALSMCKPMTSNEPLEVVRVITNEGTIEVKSSGSDGATGFIPMNSMHEAGVAFVLRVHPGLGKGLKGLLDRFSPPADNSRKVPEQNGPQEDNDTDMALKMRV
jgi:hypothetical protein